MFTDLIARVQLDSVRNLEGSLTEIATKPGGGTSAKSSHTQQKHKATMGWQACQAMHKELLTNPSLAFSKYFTTLRQQCFKVCGLSSSYVLRTRYGNEYYWTMYDVLT
jgi:hypothetical protein